MSTVISEATKTRTLTPFVLDALEGKEQTQVKAKDSLAKSSSVQTQPSGLSREQLAYRRFLKLSENDRVLWNAALSDFNNPNLVQDCNERLGVKDYKKGVRDLPSLVKEFKNLLQALDENAIDAELYGRIHDIKRNYPVCLCKLDVVKLLDFLEDRDALRRHIKECVNLGDYVLESFELLKFYYYLNKEERSPLEFEAVLSSLSQLTVNVLLADCNEFHDWVAQESDLNHVLPKRLLSSALSDILVKRFFSRLEALRENLSPQKTEQVEASEQADTFVQKQIDMDGVD
jgi:hypothetical protein